MTDCKHGVSLRKACHHCKEEEVQAKEIAALEAKIDALREENGALRAAAERQALTPKYPQRWCKCGLVESDDAWRRSGDSRACPDCKTVWPENLWRRDTLWRREVVRFADEMERALRERDDERGDSWRNESVDWLLARLRDEVQELADVLFGTRTNNAVIEEAVDVANFAMFISERVREGLRSMTPPKAPKAMPGQAGDKVDHPSHYGGKDNPYEAIKVIEAWDLGFCLGNTVKYISRAGKKSGDGLLDDLSKARWYLDRQIQRIQKG